MDRVYHKNKKRDILIFGAAFILLFILQRFYFGFHYFPVIDDWFLYLGNSTAENQWTDVILANGLLGLRPLACMIDSYFIIPLVQHLAAPYTIISLMLASAVLLISRTLSKRGVYAGAFCIAALALCPVNMEATYWMSASSRICTALFFIAWNGFFLERYLSLGQKRYLVLNIVSGIFCVSLYETAIPVYAVYYGIILFYHKTDRKRHLKLVLIPVITCAAIALYYLLNAGQEVASRGALVHGDYMEHFSYVSQQIGHIFFYLFPRILKEGWIQGMEILQADMKGALYLVLFVVISVFFGFTYVRILRSRKFCLSDGIRTAVCGILLIAAGLAVNYPLEYVRISLRVVFFAVLGIGILVDLLFVWLSSYRGGRYVTGIVAALVVFVFSVSWVGENDFYRMTSMIDNQVADALLQEDTKEKILSPDVQVILCGGNQYYFDNAVQYFEHIYTAPAMYAAITGAVRYKLGNPNIHNILVYPEWVDTPLYMTPENVSEFCVLYLKPDYTVGQGSVQFEDASIQVIGETGIPAGRFQYIGDRFIYAYEAIEEE